MFLESDEVAVLESDWKKVLAKDEEAITKMRGEINGLRTYMHVYSGGQAEEDELLEIVTLRQLQEAFVLDSVKLAAEEENTKEVTLFTSDGEEVKLVVRRLPGD